MTVPATADPGSPIDIFRSVITEKFAQFTGRARRAEYWWFTLVNIVVFILLWLLLIILSAIGDFLAVLGFLIYAVYSLAVIIPSIAVAVRRLHDTGKSGWWILIGFVPLIGFIVLLVFYLTDGDRGDNQYGPSPKYIT